jgi:hypothetical protein
LYKIVIKNRKEVYHFATLFEEMNPIQIPNKEDRVARYGLVDQNNNFLAMFHVAVYNNIVEVYFAHEGRLKIYTVDEIMEKTVDGEIK